MPEEKKLGSLVSRTIRSGRSQFKQEWDNVYVVPLLASLQQLLSDKFILEEVLKWNTLNNYINNLFL